MAKNICRPEYGAAGGVNVNLAQPVRFIDGRDTDAFGRLRISEPESVFDFKRDSDEYLDLFYSSKITNSGSVVLLTSSAECRLVISGTAGDLVEQQTKTYFNYQPAKSQVGFMTFNFNGGTPGIVKKVGMYDTDNGVYFELSGTTWAVGRRSSVTGNPVDSQTIQSNWNIDKMDGTGPSRVSLSSSMSQIGIIDYEWLGVGRIRYGFIVDGQIHYCHKIDFSNISGTVWASSPRLPFKCEIQALDTVATTASLSSFCQSVASEGGHSPVRVERSIDRGTVATSIANTAMEPILSIRLKSDQKKASVAPVRYKVFADASANFLWRAYMNPVVTGGSAAVWVPVSSSAIEFDITRNGTISSGYILASGYSNRDVAVDFDVNTLLRLGSDLAGNFDEIVLCAQPLAAGSSNFYGSIIWEELL